MRIVLLSLTVLAVPPHTYETALFQGRALYVHDSMGINTVRYNLITIN